jgi:hypothetical protein
MSTSHTVGVSRADSADPTDVKDKKRLQTWTDLLQHTKARNKKIQFAIFTPRAASVITR